MANLNNYRAKRRFERTPEPRGKPQKRAGRSRFVVQKHDASRLHYDFRLEMDGVLKSWAVPKGPSLNPADKRLAIMVEDHPLEYRNFEGNIPEGSYGAGAVMVWDEGTYEPVEISSPRGKEKNLHEGLDTGHLRFVLHGQKLRGEFSLVKLQRGKANEWLLIKHRDEFASEDDVLGQDHSVTSRRSLEQIAHNAPGRGKVMQAKAPPPRKARDFRSQSDFGSPNQAAKTRAPAPSASMPHKVKPRDFLGKQDRGRGRYSDPAKPASIMPHRISPMLATLVEESFDRPGWLFEIKWDGYRAIAEIEQGKVRLYSRNFLSFDQRFPSLVRSLTDFGHDAVLDGEIVVLDEKGKSEFQRLQDYRNSGAGALVYYVFDLLFLDGKDLRELPLKRRKALLAPLLKGNTDIRLSEHVEERGIAFFKAAVKQGLEGIMAKNGASPYREGVRGLDWLKIKARKQQEAVIGGFTQPRGSRQDLGALVLGVFDGDELVYIGHAGGGFDTQSLALVRAKLDPLIQPACSFKQQPKTNAPVRWVKPALVCEVAFQEWTKDGIMRQPIFLGLREDQSPHAVKREMPEALPEPIKASNRKHPRARKRSQKLSRQAGSLSLRKTRIVDSASNVRLPDGKFTNLEKIYWPEEGFTKGDVLRYYHEIAPFIVPYLSDRPLTLHRHPNGISGQSFFQKDVSRQSLPAGVRTVTITAESRGKETTYVVGQDEATLLYVANLGCIEMNPWNSRVSALDNPDYLILDLDPQGVPFAAVVETAQEIRKLLEKRCSECFCKTSGKRGLHIYLPLAARYDHDQARRFAEIIANLVHERLPDTTSIVRQPSGRRHQVYIDFLQNGRGQTVAAPYSLRPVAGACVSTPLAWREVNKKLDPTRFTIATMRRRLDTVGDLWKPVLAAGIDLEKCLRGIGVS